MWRFLAWREWRVVLTPHVNIDHYLAISSVSLYVGTSWFKDRGEMKSRSAVLIYCITWSASSDLNSANLSPQLVVIGYMASKSKIL